MSLLLSRKYSLVELIISISIFGTLLVMIYQILFSAQKSFSQQSIKQSLEFQANKTFHQINKDLLSVSNLNPPGISGLTIPAVPGEPLPPQFDAKFPHAIPLITFSRINGWSSAEEPMAIPPSPGPTFEPKTTYFFHPAKNEIDGNNVDDNHNGLVDEGHLYKLFSEGDIYKTQLVCRYLREINPSSSNSSLPKSSIFPPDKLKGIRFEYNAVNGLILFELALQKAGQDGRLYSSSIYSVTKLRN